MLPFKCYHYQLMALRSENKKQKKRFRSQCGFTFPEASQGLILEKSLGKVIHPGNRFNEVGIWQGCRVDGCLQKYGQGKWDARLYLSLVILQQPANLVGQVQIKVASEGITCNYCGKQNVEVEGQEISVQGQHIQVLYIEKSG